MAIILTSNSETPEQLREALVSTGQKVEVIVEGTPPGQAEVQVEEPAKTEAEAAEKVADTKADEGTVSDKGTDKEEKKDNVETEAKDKPEDAEKVASEDTEPKNRADRKLLKRIDSVTAHRNQLKETVAERDARIAELEATLAGRPKEEPVKEEPEAQEPKRPKMPVASDPEIGYDEEKLTAAREKYERDMDSYDKESREFTKAQTAKEIAAQQKREQEDREAATTVKAFTQRIEAAQAHYEDWDEVAEALSKVGDVTKLHPAVYRAIIESEQGPHILYHLGTNLEEAEEFLELNPATALRKIGRLEAKFEDGGRKKPRDKAAEPEPDKKTPTTETKTSSETKTTAQTRKPMETLTGGSKSNATSALDIAVNGGSASEYARLRAAEREAKGLRP